MGAPIRLYTFGYKFIIVGALAKDWSPLYIESQEYSQLDQILWAAKLLRDVRSSRLLQEPSPAPRVPAQAGGCSCHFPFAGLHHSEAEHKSQRHRHRTHTQRTVTRLVTQTAMDKVLPSTAPTRSTHIRRKHRQPSSLLFSVW